MSLPRFAARTLLASLFATRGLRALRQPAELVAVVEPVTDRLVPLAQRYAPSHLGSYIPSDTATLVRLGGLAQVVGAVALATGRGRRPAALVLAATTVPQLVANSPLGARSTAVDHPEGVPPKDFVTHLALLGGLLLAAQDTEGRPSLAWRASASGEKVAAKGAKARKRLSKQATDARKQAKKAAKKVEKKLD